MSTLTIQTNLKDEAGGRLTYTFRFEAVGSSSAKQLAIQELHRLLDAKNAGQAIIIQSTMLDTSYIVHAYVE
jgi:hypothetical protein